MTTLTHVQVLTDVIEIMRELAGDWQYSGPLTPDTRLYADMEMQSLDFVTLAAAVVNKYGHIPFDEFYSELAEQPVDEREVTIREFVEFVCSHRLQSSGTK